MLDNNRLRQSAKEAQDREKLEQLSLGTKTKTAGHLELSSTCARWSTAYTGCFGQNLKGRFLFFWRRHTLQTRFRSQFTTIPIWTKIPGHFSLHITLQRSLHCNGSYTSTVLTLQRSLYPNGPYTSTVLTLQRPLHFNGSYTSTVLTLERSLHPNGPYTPTVLTLQRPLHSNDSYTSTVLTLERSLHPNGHYTPTGLTSQQSLHSLTCWST